MTYPDDFNSSAFSSHWGDAPARLGDDYDFVTAQRSGQGVIE